MIRLAFLFVGLLAASPCLRAAELADLLAERLKAVVAVEFTVQTELERRPVTVFGTVVDDQGTVVLPGTAIAPGQAPDELKEFKAYRPGSDEEYGATYLGQDALTGWYFVRVEEKMRPHLVPITRFAAAKDGPALGEELWGIGLRNKDEDFAPYLLSSRTAIVTRLPNRTAICAQEVASPGLPVFNRTGEFAGLALNSFGQNFLIFSQRQHGAPVLLVNVEESSVVLLNDEVRPNLGRVPATVTGRPIAWIGIYGLQPVDSEVAKFLKLDRASGVVLSDILAGGPADQAGLQDRDIVLAINGEALPRLRPDRVVVNYFGQEVLKRRPGDVLKLTVLRGAERREIEVKLGDEPKLVREADRRYFDRLGFTVREFLVFDRIGHRAQSGETGGGIVHLLKPNGAAATAGLRPDDWIREVDGAPVADYAETVAKLSAIDREPGRGEFVLLVRRGGETQVLRVKLN